MNTEKSTLKNSLTLAALGVVFGDIGTSPLYAFREAFHHTELNQTGIEYIFGVLSLIVWSLIFVVSIKYLFFVMKADNKGEGGVFALTALISSLEGRYKKMFFVLLGLFGSALLFGDGVLTPSVSILSAVEGLKVATPHFANWVVPITIVILLALFYVQKQGTQTIGTIFGPIIFLWFLSIGILGVLEIIKHPQIIEALNPYYGVKLLIDDFQNALYILGAVFLAVTGAEALYADMGHFGIKPIQRAWFFVAFPGLVLNYMGQAALVITDPSTIKNPFYLLVPHDFILPMVILATLAAVIASQALITGVFSITKQGIQLGYLPRFNIRHTSDESIGQIYVPKMNWILCALTIWLVIEFKSSSELAAAYGIAVSLTMFITTLLISYIAYKIWKWSILKLSLFLIVFLVIDAIFLSANLLKIADGGWIPLLMGVVIFVMMQTWKKGRQLLFEKLKIKSISLTELVKEISYRSPSRVQGTAFFLSGDPDKTPLALLHNLKHNKILHERNFILNIKTLENPYVESSKRLEIIKIADQLFKVTAIYGFSERPDINDIILHLNKKDFDIVTSDVTFFLGRENLVASSEKTFPMWRKYLFIFLSQNSERANIFFKIPSDQLIEVGVQVDI